MKEYLLIGFVASILMVACHNDMADIEELASKFNTEVEEANEVEILYSDSAKVRVRVTGSRMLSYLSNSETQQEFPDGVFVEFFDASGAVTSQLSAKYGLRIEQKDEVIVRDSVVWKSNEGEQLETEELIWEERKKRVYTNKFVVVTRPDEIIYGHGFEADQDFSYSRINAIEGRLKVNENKGKNQEQE